MSNPLSLRKWCANAFRFFSSGAHSPYIPSACMLVLTRTTVTRRPAILDRRGALELGGSQLLLDIPVSMTIRRGIKEGTLQGRHRTIDGALTPARDAGESVLGSRAKGGAIRR